MADAVETWLLRLLLPLMSSSMAHVSLLGFLVYFGSQNRKSPLESQDWAWGTAVWWWWGIDY